MKLRGFTITLKAASLWLEDDGRLITDIQGRIRRSLPPTESLQKDPLLTQVLRQAVVEYGVVCRDLAEIPGLESAYKGGYLHASFRDQEGTLYTFPSSFHHR